MKPPQPPRAADRLLAVFCAPHLLEAVQGDLHEEFDFQAERLGERKARWWYWREVLGFLKPFALRRQSNEFNQPFFLSPAMLRNYFKIAWRNLIHARIVSMINGFGLALGIACALIIFLMVSHETRYDQHHANANRIYRVETENIDEKHAYPGTYTEMPQALRSEVPELEAVAPVWQNGESNLSVPGSDKLFKESVVFAGSDLFRLLDYRWRAGDARKALAQPNTVVLTQSRAEKFFGTADAVGKTLRFGANQDLLVTGVLEDHPTTTNFPLNVLVSFATLKRVNPGYDQYGWNGFGDNFQVYALLKQGFRPEQLTKPLGAIVTKYIRREEAPNKRFVLRPLAELHYQYNLAGRTANPKLLDTLALIGGFVLLIACINFINLTTAQALKRAKEIGIRKAVGGNRISLVYQFLAEAGLITLLATLVAVGAAWALLPLVATVLEIPLTPTDLFAGRTAVFVAGLFVVTTLLAGAYPAFRLSGMAPIWALTTNRLPRGGPVTLRQGLVVVQFTVSLVLISSTLLINRQLSLFQNADLGFDKAAILTVGIPDNKAEKLQTFRNQLIRSPQVKDVSFSFNSASAESNWMEGIQYRPSARVVDIRTQMKFADAHYLNTYGIRLLAGTALAEGDTIPKVIVNEVFVGRMGLKRLGDAVGQTIYLGQQALPIVGVAKNFNVNSLHQNIDPTLLVVAPHYFYQGSIKLQSQKLTPETLQAALAHIEKVWTATFPNQLFEYRFLDETLAQAYKNETRTAKLIQTATLLALVIACLGLFGLATFTAEQRTKEIGVRKVLGASVASIVALLSKDFLKLVLVAFVIASPLAWYAMNRWLQDFAYKITIEWWVFALAGALAVGIALLTVSFQSIKAALMNPVKSLRSE